MLSQIISAQIQQAGEPWSNMNLDLTQNETLVLEANNVTQLKVYDQTRDLDKNQPYRFGEEILVNLNMQNSGVWTELEDGKKVWTLKVSSPNALAISFLFDSFYIPEGGRMLFTIAIKLKLLVHLRI